MAITEERASLTLAGRDLGWLVAIMQNALDAFSVTAVHSPDAMSTLSFPLNGRPHCAVVELDSKASAVDIRGLLDRSPNVHFVFAAEQLPLRHAVARVIRERGHTALAWDESPFVITATAVALLAGCGAER